MEKPVWDASLSAELRDGIVQCIRAARDWEFRCVAANGARIRIVNVGSSRQLRRFLYDVLEQAAVGGGDTQTQSSAPVPEITGPLQQSAASDDAAVTPAP